MACDIVTVEGKRVLCGEIWLQGSKNAALPMLAASVLNKGITELNNCPDISDVKDMTELLESIGCKVVRNRRTVIIDAVNLTGYEVPKELAKRTRGSFIMLGALLSRMGRARVPYPGGCPIGSRPVDIHIKALEKIGMEPVSEMTDEAFVVFRKKSDVNVRLSYPSVGATENAILASVLGEGCVVLRNCAREPEIVALCGLLTAMGANIKGAGTSIISIRGVGTLHDAKYKIPGDRIVAGTYMTAAMISRGSVTVRGINTKEILSEVELFHKAGASITMWDNTIHIRSSGVITPIRRIVTKPYPGFPTDMQSQIMSMLIYADGKSSIVENVFENRFMTVDELIKMGANIRIQGKTAIITPAGHLYGADMCATDLRGGAALVLAALGAIGKSKVSGYRHIERGYEELAGNLSMLGADIRPVT